MQISVPKDFIYLILNIDLNDVTLTQIVARFYVS